MNPSSGSARASSSFSVLLEFRDEFPHGFNNVRALRVRHIEHLFVAIRENHEHEAEAGR
jgi:hypothetical protein